MQVDEPDSYTPCYGRQIKYKMPGGNFMYIHLKDKSKIRHKKRWSQVSCVSKYTHLDLLIIYYRDISNLRQRELNKYEKQIQRLISCFVLF